MQNLQEEQKRKIKKIKGKLTQENTELKDEISDIKEVHAKELREKDEQRKELERVIEATAPAFTEDLKKIRNEFNDQIKQNLDEFESQKEEIHQMYNEKIAIMEDKWQRQAELHQNEV